VTRGDFPDDDASTLAVTFLVSRLALISGN
jgi:hypothetical protein